MVTFRKTIAGSLIWVTTFQTLFFGSGLFGFFLSEGAKICTCNHNSSQEIHAKGSHTRAAEDKLWKSPALRLGNQNSPSLGLFSTLEDQELSPPSLVESSALPSCHDAKPGETHLCECKKSAQSTEILKNHYSPIFYEPSMDLDLPESKTELTRVWSPGKKPDRPNPLPWIPPKQIQFL
jgi:hypothetical protein